MRISVIVGLVFVLAGCASEADLMARDEARCRDFGFAAGSEAYSNCRLQLYTERTRRPVVIDRGPYFPSAPRVIVVPEKK